MEIGLGTLRLYSCHACTSSSQDTSVYFGDALFSTTILGIRRPPLVNVLQGVGTLVLLLQVVDPHQPLRFGVVGGGAELHLPQRDHQPPTGDVLVVGVEQPNHL